MSDERPRLRPVDPVQISQDGEPMFALRDQSVETDGGVTLSSAALLVAALMDGTRTMAAIASDSSARLGRTVTESHVEQVRDALSKACLLQDERYQERMLRRRDEYRSAPVRQARHAGTVYPGDGAGCAAFLDQMLGDSGVRPGTRTFAG